MLILAGGVAAYLLIRQYNGSNVQAYFETATYVIAAACPHGHDVLDAQARAHDVEGAPASAATSRSQGNALGPRRLSFQAVGREGLETMVFTLAIVFASSRQAATPVHGDLLLIGAALGLAVALALAFAMYRLGAKLNLANSFASSGSS